MEQAKDRAKLFTCKLYPPEYVRLYNKAKKHHVSMAHLIRSLITKYVELL